MSEARIVNVTPGAVAINGKQMSAARSREASQLRCSSTFQGRRCNKLLCYISGTDFHISLRCTRCKQLVQFSRSPRELAVAK